MKKFLFALAATAFGIMAASAQYCPVKLGTVLKYSDVKEQPSRTTANYTYTVDSVYTADGKDAVRILVQQDKAGTLSTEPDSYQYSFYTAGDADAPTTVLIMDGDQFRQMAIDEIVKEIQGAGQMVSASDLEEVTSQIRPSGKLQLVLDQNDAKGKIPSASLRVSLGAMASMSFHITSGKILGKESVTVPAGTFENCLKISYIEKSNMGEESMKEYVTAWYAPGIGLVKEESKTKGGELIELQTLESVSVPE